MSIASIFITYCNIWPIRFICLISTIVYAAEGFHALPDVMNDHVGKSETKKAMIATGFVGSMGLAGFLMGATAPISVPLTAMYMLYKRSCGQVS